MLQEWSTDADLGDPALCSAMEGRQGALQVLLRFLVQPAVDVRRGLAVQQRHAHLVAPVLALEVLVPGSGRCWTSNCVL